MRDAIASRFLDLDELALEPLRRLALAGDELDSTAAVALAGPTEPEAFAVLDEALRAGRAAWSSDAHYRFRHELVRQALVDQLPPHQRAAAHREAAEQLAAAGAAPGLRRSPLAGGRAAR